MDVSKWVLQQLFPTAGERFQHLCRSLDSAPEKRKYVFAELNDFLSQLSARELIATVRHAPSIELPTFEANYLTAMVEQASAGRRVSPPNWTRRIKPLEQPWFATNLKSLGLHLLTTSPPPFRRRNLFVDSSIGDRV